MKQRQHSLKRPLIVQPLLLSLVVLITTFSLVIALLLQAVEGGEIVDEGVAAAAARAVVRKDDGGLAVRMTPELARLRAETPALWFIAEDDDGRAVSFGPVPEQFESFAGLRDLSFGDIRSPRLSQNLSAVIRRMPGPAGILSVMAHGKTAPLTLIVVLMSNIIIIPIFLLLALASFIMTPWIVNRALAGVSRIAQEAQQIEIDRPDIQLSEEFVPVEIIPLVTGINDALRRLNAGYLRQRRFITTAAHELRTPIAILRIKIDSASDETARRLCGDVARLANLAEQLLDLHRIEDDEMSELVELGSLVRRVASEVAPLLIVQRKSIEISVDEAGSIVGNTAAIERVVTNLVLNAVEHGGENVTIRVRGASFEVEDDGPGIPVEGRDLIFEPFQRLSPQSTGTGLGLHLVQQVVGRYRGHISILDAPGGGTIFRVEFPIL